VSGDPVRIPTPAIVAFTVTIVGVALGAWFDAHRLFLSLYFTASGTAWFVAARSIVHNEAYLRYLSEARSRLPWYRNRSDFIERDIRFQRRMLTWLLEPVGLCLSLIGVIMLVGEVIGRTT
jgi:hypothetical protein